MTTLFDIKAHKGDIGGSICTPYKFNGKELDQETGYYYYGARYYDPQTALWFGTDPLAQKYPMNSPYVYCNGNPVIYIDPDGQSPIYDTQGEFLGTDDTGLKGYYYVMDKDKFTQGMSHIDAGNFAVLGPIPSDVESNINEHYDNLPNRPDYDGVVTIGEGIRWAKSHPDALENPTPDNMLYLDASNLDFGALSTSDFPKVGVIKSQNLFSNQNIVESIANPNLMSTVYALGRVDMILTNRDQRTVKIVNNLATDYDWNVGGGLKRNAFIRTNNAIFGIDPNSHGFKTFYYGVGKLRK